MKKFLSMILSILLLGLLICPALALNIEQSSDCEFSMETCYPIINTAEWAEMERAERVAACQISDDRLAEMSTEELMWTVLEYPFMIDLYAFDTYREGFLHVYNEFHALQELASREDFGHILAATYQALPVADVVGSYSETADNTDLYQHIRDLSVMEILIAQPEMTDDLDSEIIDSLLLTANNKYLEKYDALDINSGNLTTFYAAVEESSDSTIAVAYVGATVYTPNGSRVAVEDHSSTQDWSDAEKAQRNAEQLTSYPGIYVIHDPCKRYNCHSYAWYYSSPLNYYIMYSPEAYMTDGSYTSTTSFSVGNKVYWKSGVNPVHSGIIVDTSTVESKWGQLGVYRHSLSECPYYGTTSYWTR